MATLTRLAPDAVVHNVMPVFTFMGSNVFHRDDTYSFRVVEKVRRDNSYQTLVLMYRKDHRRHRSSHGLESQEITQ